MVDQPKIRKELAMSTKRKRYDPDIKARAALAVHKNEEVIFLTIAQFGDTPGLDHRMEMREAGSCAVSYVYLAETQVRHQRFGLRAIHAIREFTNLPYKRSFMAVRNSGHSESTASHQKNTLLPNKKAGSPFQATRLSFSRSAAFRPYLTMGLAFTEFVTNKPWNN
jgi:hypothetical protein